MREEEDDDADKEQYGWENDVSAQGAVTSLEHLGYQPGSSSLVLVNVGFISAFIWVPVDAR